MDYAPRLVEEKFVRMEREGKVVDLWVQEGRSEGAEGLDKEGNSRSKGRKQNSSYHGVCIMVSGAARGRIVNLERVTDGWTWPDHRAASLLPSRVTCVFSLQNYTMVAFSFS